MLVTSAAVVAPLTPPLLIDLAVPPVRVASRANPLVVPISAVTVPVTGKSDWLDAITTGVLAAMVFWPRVLMRVVNVVSANLVANVVSVEKSVVAIPSKTALTAASVVSLARVASVVSVAKSVNPNAVKIVAIDCKVASVETAPFML